MPNTAEYKDYLFVKVPEDATDWVIKKWPDHDVLFFLDVEREPDWIELPPGSWQIIGKGDAIDWEGIVSKAEITDPRGHQVTAMDSAISILLTYGMRPSTTLVLKKQTKLK